MISSSASISQLLFLSWWPLRQLWQVHRQWFFVGIQAIANSFGQIENDYTEVPLFFFLGLLIQAKINKVGLDFGENLGAKASIPSIKYGQQLNLQ